MEQFVRNNRGLFFTKGIRRDSYVSIYISARGSKLCLAENKKKKALRVIDNFFINHMLAYLLLGLFDLVVHSLLHFARILISQDSKLKSFQASKGEKRRKHRKTWNRPSSNLEISVEQLANAEKHDTSAERVTISLVVFSFFFFVQLGQ